MYQALLNKYINSQLCNFREFEDQMSNGFLNRNKHHHNNCCETKFLKELFRAWLALKVGLQQMPPQNEALIWNPFLKLSNEQLFGRQTKVDW
jgi:hypothetical protein